MGSAVAMVGARHVDPESVRLLWRFSYFGAGGRASAGSIDVARHFCGVVSCFLLGLGLGWFFFLVFWFFSLASPNFSPFVGLLSPLREWFCYFLLCFACLELRV
ncbi:hypothetical protein RHMOL_Rhmol05G0233600 [Rhododendron molle]|uniref:Uncharacterized protein n=1 Tax=Rhododendron molle TaxID=49168 RepID=A0ACC0NTA8_RHOML|nr:hypothetical protein RHMOL_Rhmol05G0233600 [Rhododendron molle]